METQVELSAMAPFIGMDREWTAEEKAGLNDVLRQYGWKDAETTDIADAVAPT